jgi:hypothetical protein
MRRVPLENRWVSEKWELAEVRPDTGESPLSRVALGDDAWLWRGLALDLHTSEGEGYYLNLTAPEPCVFVMWRLEEWEGIETARPWVATASYNEAARMMDAGETVETRPMPASVRDWMAPFVEANYRPEPRRKHRRNEKFWHEEAGEASDGQTLKGERR